MLTNELEIANSARDQVEFMASQWLNTIDNWTPVPGHAHGTQAPFTVRGQYSVIDKLESSRTAGKGHLSADSESQARARIATFVDNWTNHPNQSQREEIFHAIDSRHQSLPGSSTELSSMSETWLVRCDSCNGHGSTNCHGCGASGKVTCRTCSGRREVTCSVCNGSRGRYTDDYNRHWTNCGACNGSGKQLCRSCDYAGKQTCSSCGGSGDIGCRPCRETGCFTENLTGSVRLTMRHDLTFTGTDKRLNNLASEACQNGLSGRFPSFNVGQATEWNSDLVVEPARAGEYHSIFSGQIPFYFVKMKPDSRFGGDETLTIFAGANFYPVSLGYIFDTTVHRLVEGGSKDVDTGKADITRWTASNLGNQVHTHALEGKGQTLLEAMTGISRNGRDILLSGYQSLTNQLQQTDRRPDLPVVLKRTLIISGIAYAMCVLVAFFGQMYLTSEGHALKANWSNLGTSFYASSIFWNITNIFDGYFFAFRDMTYFLWVIPGTLAAAYLLRTKLWGVKPWSRLMIFLLVLVSFLAVDLLYSCFWQLFDKTEAIYAITIRWTGALADQLTGAVLVIPEIAIVSAFLAYRRIKKGQEDDIRATIHELQSPSLKQQFGF